MIEKVELNMKKQDLGGWDERYRSSCDIKDMVGKKVTGITVKVYI